MKRIVVISDLHCGHMAGLTPPGWHSIPHDATCRRRRKLAEAQIEAWKWYAAQAKELRPVHAVFVNGDAIDGKGDKSGGTEQITTDCNEQVRMATAAIKIWGAQKHRFTYGTGYHTGKAEDFEDTLAEVFDAKIGAHEWPSVGKVVFDLKHHLGSSQIPHGRTAALEREALWNKLWAAEKYQPDADIIIRSHVHYLRGTYEYFAGKHRWRFSTPALQGMGSKYGARRCSGMVNYGFLAFDIMDDGAYSCRPIVAELPSQRAVADPV